MTATSAARYTTLALLFSLLWASGFVAMKIALRDAPPLLLMVPRFLVAGGALLAIARLRGRRLPAGWRQWWPLIVVGVLNNALYLGCSNALLRHVSAGMGAVLASTNPLVLAVVAPRWLGEPLTAGKAVGLLTSYVGVAVVMGTRIGADNEGWAMGAWLATVVFLVAGTVLFKRWRPAQDLTAMTGVQVLAAGVALIPPALALESMDDVRVTTSLLVAQTWLVIVVSGAAMLLWLWLLQHGDATRASAYFFLNPVLGLLLAALFLGEPLHALDLGGGALVAAGIYLVQRGALRPPAPAPTPRSRSGGTG